MTHPFARRLRLVFRIATSALLFTACTGEVPEAPTAVLDLLARRPDTVFDQPGLLVPHEKDEWGPLGISGWFRATLKDAQAGDHVATVQPIAVLNLPAAGPEARTIEVEMWCPEPRDGSAPRAQLRLNGRPIHTEEILLLPTPQRFAFVTPEPLWHQGENRLEIEALRPEGEERWNRLCVSRVEYGPAREVVITTTGTATALLAPSTGLRYFVETPAGGSLTLRGRTEGEGSLEVRFAEMAPPTGEVRREGFFEETITARNGIVAGTLSLPRQLGGVLALEFGWRSEAGASLALEELTIDEKSARARPPVLFISIDTYAARHLSLYGYDRETAPHLVRFADDAVLFERCVVNAPWTMPSYLSVLTGLYPRAHLADLESAPGVELGNYDLWQVADNRWTMAEMFRSHGYQTAGFVDTLWLLDKFRVAQGFDLYDVDAADSRLPFQNPAYGIVFVMNRVSEWLDTRDEEVPYFLFLHALDAHGPYWPEFPFRYRFHGDMPKEERFALAWSEHMTGGAIPDWMAETHVEPRYARDRIDLEKLTRALETGTGPEPNPQTLSVGDLLQMAAIGHWPEPRPRTLSVDAIIARYDEALLKVDAYLGRILDELVARGLYDETLIVITGDHGESFDHDFYGHGRMWEDIVHVPLLVKMPHQEFAGRRVSDSVQLVDLYPTLREVIGGKVPREDLHGRSLLPLMRGEAVSPHATFCEGGHLEQYMVERDGWKLVRSRPGVGSGDVTLLSHRMVPKDWLAENFPYLVDEALTEGWWLKRKQAPDYAAKVAELRELLAGPFDELFHLPEDPDELRNVAAAYPEKVEELSRLLREHRQKGIDASKNARPSAIGAAFDDAALEALRALGYVGAEEEGEAADEAKPDMDEEPPKDEGK